MRGAAVVCGLALASGLSACSGEGDELRREEFGIEHVDGAAQGDVSGATPTPTETTYTTVRHACLVPGGASEGEVEASQPVRIMAIFNSCLSSCGSVVKEASCEARLEEGNVIEVEGQATVARSSEESSVCTAECRPLRAFCRLPDLAEGSYSVAYGNDERTVRVPGLDSCR